MPKNWQITPANFLSPEESMKLLEIAKARADKSRKRGGLQAEVNYMLIDLGLHTGLRASELANLKIEDIFTKKDDSQLIVRKGKGDRSGLVKFGEPTRRHILRYLKDTRPRLVKAVIEKDSYKAMNQRKSHWKDEGYFFIGVNGQKLTRFTIYHRFKTMVKQAGIEGRFSPHAMRHTCATELLRKTKNLRVVQKQLRHSRLSTTAVYADVMDKEWRAAVEKLFMADNE